MLVLLSFLPLVLPRMPFWIACFWCFLFFFFFNFRCCCWIFNDVFLTFFFAIFFTIFSATHAWLCDVVGKKLILGRKFEWIWVRRCWRILFGMLNSSRFRKFWDILKHIGTDISIFPFSFVNCVHKASKGQFKFNETQNSNPKVFLHINSFKSRLNRSIPSHT